MKKLSIIVVAALLAGCQTTEGANVDIDSGTLIIDGEDIGSVKAAQIPDLPDDLKKRAPSLEEMTDPSLRGQQIYAMDADISYNGVAHQLNTVLDAFACIRTTFNDKGDPNKCFKDRK